MSSLYFCAHIVNVIQRQSEERSITYWEFFRTKASTIRDTRIGTNKRAHTHIHWFLLLSWTKNAFIKFLRRQNANHAWWCDGNCVIDENVTHSHGVNLLFICVLLLCNVWGIDDGKIHLNWWEQEAFAHETIERYLWYGCHDIWYAFCHLSDFLCKPSALLWRSLWECE